MSTTKEQYRKDIIKKMQDAFSYGNTMQVPKILKVVLNRRLGEATQNSKVIDISRDELIQISGQRPMMAKAKKSISNFKLREGQIIGSKVTLRGDRMYDFLTKLIHICLPKIRDFRGISPYSFDGMGNYSLGVKECIIFPEVDYEKMDKIRGLDVTIVTSSKTNEEAFKLLSLFGMPFAKKAETSI
ncbi:MAG: 50S ribosomal protein L5 [Candidatus Margulisbacteria bacterium]|nr:50S ribosomal protein L5 [Candidatus Margulisiibacteriota bacterium]